MSLMPIKRLGLLLHNSNLSTGILHPVCRLATQVHESVKIHPKFIGFLLPCRNHHATSGLLRTFNSLENNPGSFSMQCLGTLLIRRPKVGSSVHNNV